MVTERDGGMGRERQRERKKALEGQLLETPALLRGLPSFSEQVKLA